MQHNSAANIEPELERPTKRGNVRQSEFEGEAFLSSLDPVVNELAVEVAAAKLDRKALAALSAGLQQFQENALGINAYPPKPFPKLPATLFRDLKPRGALFIIAAACARTMLARGLKKLDFTNPALRKQNMEVLASVRRSVQQAGFLHPYKVALHSSLDAAQLPRLQGIVTKLGAELVSNAEVGNCTHVVYPFGSSGDPDDGQNYMRSLEARGPEVRVHWWYKPDSYDEFLPAATAPAELEPDTPHPGVWQVYIRWLLDSEKYNEWMNPGDYETEAGATAREALEAAAAKAGTHGKRAANGLHDDATAPDAKRAAAMSAPEVSAWSEDLGNGVVRQTVINPHAAAMDGSAAAIDLSFGQRPPEARGVPVALPPLRSPTQLGIAMKARSDCHTADQSTPAATIKPEPDDPAADASAAARATQLGDTDTDTIAATQAALTTAIPDQMGQNSGVKIEAQSNGEMSVGVAPSQADNKPPLVTANVSNSTAKEAPCPGSASPERASPTQTAGMPAHAAWYDPGTVHALEQHLLPAGTAGEPPLSAEAYREQRATAVAAYNSDPSRRLTCEEAVGCGVAPRVWAFLDSWGIINYRATNKGRSDTGDGGVADVYAFSDVTLAQALAAAARGGPGAPIMPYSHMEASQHISPLVEPEAREQQYKCAAMPWVDCTEVRYERRPAVSKSKSQHSAPAAAAPHGLNDDKTINLCPLAFAEGRFPAGLSARDFRLVKGPRVARADVEEWSQHETLLLLEGIQLYGEVWPKVAAHVGTKPSFKCALRFLQLPIEECFATSILAHEQDNLTRAGLHGDAEEPLPFADAENPVMALLTLLMTAVAPPVAAAAAQKALQVLSEWAGDANLPYPPSLLQKAAGEALQAAAIKAKLLADAEERAVCVVVAEAAKAEVEVVRRKLAAVSAMDAIVEGAASEAAARAAELTAQQTALRDAPLRMPQLVQAGNPLSLGTAMLNPVSSTALGMSNGGVKGLEQLAYIQGT